MSNIQIARQYADMMANFLADGGKWASDLSNCPPEDRPGVIIEYKKIFKSVDVNGTQCICTK